MPPLNIDEEAVPRAVHDIAAVQGEKRLDDVGAQRHPVLVRPLLVELQQPGVTDDLDEHDGRRTPLRRRSMDKREAGTWVSILHGLAPEVPSKMGQGQSRYNLRRAIW